MSDRKFQRDLVESLIAIGGGLATVKVVSYAATSDPAHAFRWICGVMITACLWGAMMGYVLTRQFLQK